jgi:hypothetical protein
MHSLGGSPLTFKKTLAGRAELQDRSHKLTLIERQVLILCDGKRSMDQLEHMLGMQLAQELDKLQSHGLLQDIDLVTGDFDAGSGFDRSVDEPDTGAQALERFESASAHLFRAKAVVVAATAPITRINVSNTQTNQAPTMRGILYGKRLLLETMDHLGPREAILLTRKIAQIDTEAALYYVFEQTVQAIKTRASADTVQEITRRFDEEVSRY